MATNDTFFKTQASALQYAFDQVTDKYNLDLPDHLWTEHVAYETTVKYHIPLIVKKTGNPAKKWLHISLYRMGSGTYELVHYKS